MDYADEFAILANTPAQAEFLLHSLEKAASDTGFRANANKTIYMCFYQNKENTYHTKKEGLGNQWKSSHTSEAASHLLKTTSTENEGMES